MFSRHGILTAVTLIALSVAPSGMTAAGAPATRPTTALTTAIDAATASTPHELVYRLGYTPEVAYLPGGQSVHVEPDGSCSGIPDRPFGFEFRDACRMHDLGYDLIRVGWVDASAKARIDRDLFAGMLDACTEERGIHGLVCRAMALGAWVAVSLCPTPHDPDPGSFSRPTTTSPTPTLEQA